MKNILSAITMKHILVTVFVFQLISLAFLAFAYHRLFREINYVQYAANDKYDQCSKDDIKMLRMDIDSLDKHVDRLDTTVNIIYNTTNQIEKANNRL